MKPKTATLVPLDRLSVRNSSLTQKDVTHPLTPGPPPGPSPRWGEGNEHPPVVPPYARGDLRGGRLAPTGGEDDRRSGEGEARSHTSTRGLVRTFMLLGLLALVLVQQLSAQEEPVQLKVWVDPTTITIGDVVQFTLEVTRPQAVKIALPSVGSKLSDWVVRKSEPLPVKEVSAGKVTEGLQLQLAIYKTGDVEIPPLSVEVVGPGGDRKTLASQPIKMKVQSVLDGEQLKQIKVQAEIPADYKPLLLLLAALAALGVIVYQVTRFFGKRKEAQLASLRIVRSPAEIAREAIQNLLARKLTEKGYVKEFYLELSEILKRYLGSKLGILSLERTTDEFIHDLKQAAVCWEEYDRIKTFLMDCDLVKFAKYRPSAEEIQRIVERSFEVIDAAENKKPELELLEVSNRVSR